MPGIPRVSKKAEKIAFKILGVPINMRKKPKRMYRRNKKLSYEETRDVK